ncbi:YcgL domain-containing protein [Mangrovitalea sediminis]|uniref:YcgL domain-containing protein n=1 Tax=Mangrovitalea sediminis TaxID=1982043 RepID=UPI000BE4D1D3|nr:YcgL domain-containing protein [Mangrovitalea sediminis]
MSDKRLVSIYKSRRREEMYLYVDRKAGLEKVPESLLQVFGKPEHVMHLMLGAERRLARADAAEVLQAIASQGFYLQMPPSQDDVAVVDYRKESP